MKFQNKIIDLTKTLKLSSMNQNLHIIIQLDCIEVHADKSLMLPSKPCARIYYAAIEEVKDIPEMKGNSCNMYFRFTIPKGYWGIGSSSYPPIRRPKPRRHRKPPQ